MFTILIRAKAKKDQEEKALLFSNVVSFEIKKLSVTYYGVTNMVVQVVWIPLIK